MKNNHIKMVQNCETPLQAGLRTATKAELDQRKAALTNALYYGVQHDEEGRNIRAVLRAIDEEFSIRQDLANARAFAVSQAKTSLSSVPLAAPSKQFVSLAMVVCHADIAEKIRRRLKVVLGQTMVEHGITSLHMAVSRESDTELDAVPVRPMRPHDERVLLQRLQAHLARTSGQ
jgi:hypothetical protein